jgi:kynurenine 3-monooxygenase
MQSLDKPQVTIVGAGLAGALLACQLGKSGYRVDLYEKRADPREHDQSRTRSINLAISVRGLHALREVGLADEVLRSAIAMPGRMIHSPTGQLTFQPYGKNESEAIHSVSRGDLNVVLLKAASQHENVRLHFQKKCTGIDLDTSVVELRDEVSGEITHVPSELTVGSDGAFSAVRAQMQKLDRFDYFQRYLTHGYKELTMPAAAGGSHAMEKHALHIWPRRSHMMIALPNLDGTFTCTLFWPFEGPSSFSSLQTPDDVRRYFETHFPDVPPRMPNLAQEYFDNPVGSLVTVWCQPWYVRDRVVLIGDAAHAVVPFLGQGMNAAFEDCSVLHECLQEFGPRGEGAFHAFETRRRENTDVLAELCVRNYVEMRDKVSSPLFRLHKKLDVLLSRLLPGVYLPLYTMVSFTRIPYAAALRRAQWQNRILLAVSVLLILLLIVIWRWLVQPFA